MSAVLESCHVSPLTRELIARFAGSPISSRVTIAGPSGAKPSEPFARSHCRSSRWRSRAVMSLRIVNPKTWSMARATDTREARQPMTTASSASRSSISVARGRRTGMPGSLIALGNFANSIG